MTAVLETQPATQQPQRTPGPGLSDLQSSQEIRLLILDDDPATCSLIQAALAQHDFKVDTLSDPLQAEEYLKRTQYQLIILDYVLPGLEPDQVFGWLRDHQQDASIIVVTGYPTVDSAVNSLRARTYDYLTKPFQIDALRDIVIRCLENKGLLRMTEEALRESLGSAIRERRKGLGLTLQSMSHRTGVSLGYLSQIELGKNSASIETLYRICLALGIKMSELFQAVQRSN
jgi:PleD family two-component response regulator/DNA-binding Xre family transcriptional regulator